MLEHEKYLTSHYGPLTLHKICAPFNPKSMEYLKNYFEIGDTDVFY